MLDRTVPPPFVKNSSFNLITPEEKKLHNGVHLFFVPGGFQDVLKIELVFEAGRWYENKLGAAYFTTHLLSRGTKNKSSFEIAQLFDQYGAHLEVSPGLDFVSIALYSITKNLSPVLQLMMEILSFPSFPEKELSQTQSVFIQNLKVNGEKTSFVASHLFRKNLFGTSHPYGVEIEEKDVPQIQTKDLQKHFSDFIHSPKVFVSGKIEPLSRDLILEKFQTMLPGAHTHHIAPVVNAHPGRQHVEKRESVQSSLRIGRRSVVRSHPDYVANLFISHILGGYFGSRLMKNIREDKGLTYGISASIHGLRYDGYLVIGADVNKENINLTFDEIRKELKNLRVAKITSGELETSRNHFIGSLLSEVSTPFAHAEKIKNIVLFNLQQDHYQSMIDKIEKISADEILEISEKYFHEDEFSEVVVG